MTVATREDYFAAAMDVLASSGFTAVKVGTLCDRFGVTIGSFYHYFANVDAFVDELLAYWEREQTQLVARRAVEPADPVARVARLKELAIGLPHAAEAAIRSWASVQPRVATVQRRVDEERRARLQEVIAGVVADGPTAHRLSVVGLTLLVGLQQWRSPVSQQDLRDTFDEFESMILRHAGATR